MDDESLYESWEWFKELLHRFLHHRISHYINWNNYGLNTHTRLVVDASANGSLLSKSYNEAYEIIDRITNNNFQWPTNQATSARRIAKVHEVDALTSLSAQVLSISSKLKQFTTNGVNHVATQPPIHYQGGGPNNTYMQHR